MKRKLKFAARILVMLILMALCLPWLWRTVMQKNYSNSFNSTATFTNFYSLPADSVDVLILGSSHARSSYIPQELYNRYGITSYNLASSSQAVFLSYCWLKEAFQTQKPDVVVLDTLQLFGSSDIPLVNTEGELRGALDYMRWGAVKWEAVKTILEYDREQSLVNYLLLNTRYHDRWKSLTRGDFQFYEMTSAMNLMGYSTNYSGTNTAVYTPFESEASDETTPMQPYMEEYLGRIAELCREHGARLLLVKCPSTSQTIQKHNAVADYAEKNGIQFLDMNEGQQYEALGYDYNADAVDSSGHANLGGAVKLTNFLGQYLREEYGLKPHFSGFWESTRDDYESAKTDYRLKEIENLETYLAVLSENADRYTIFIAVKDEASSSLSETAQFLLRTMGLDADWLEGYKKSYCAVIEGGAVRYEEMSDEKLSLTGSILEGGCVYTIESAGSGSGNTCTIELDGSQKARKKRGLNIVVYNNRRQLVIDSVCFDTYAEECTASR